MFRIAPAIHPENALQIHPGIACGLGVEGARGVNPGATLSAPRRLPQQGEHQGRAAARFRPADFRQSASRNTPVSEFVDGWDSRSKLPCFQPFTDFERDGETRLYFGSELKDSRAHIRLLFARTLLLQIRGKRARADLSNGTTPRALAILPGQGAILFT
jgi:hypothetical protein